jgi:hypothetical protein
MVPAFVFAEMPSAGSRFYGVVGVVLSCLI